MKFYIISDDEMVRDAFKRAIKTLTDISPEGASCQNVIHLHLAKLKPVAINQCLLENFGKK
ncbi:MAG: hypothetical protein ACE5EA_04215 [Nitrospirota bacterium]